MSEEEVKRLGRLIEEDNVDELSNILNSNEILRNNFNSCTAGRSFSKLPLLLYAVQEKSQKVVEYLLSQDFVDKYICNSLGDNIYHVVCRIRGAEQLFSFIERKVPHNLLNNSLNETNGRKVFDISHYRRSAFHIACKENTVFIVKRVHEILESLQANLTIIKNNTMYYAIKNNDIEVIKYVLSIDGVQLKDDILYEAIRSLKFDIVVYLLNVYLCQSIPSHFHNQFHIFQYSNLLYSNKNNMLNNNFDKNNEEIKEEFNSNTQKRDRGDDLNEGFINHNKKIKLSHLHTNNNKINNNNNNNSINDYFLKLVEHNFKKIIENDRIWREVCSNKDIDVAQFIFSLKGIQPDINDDEGYNPFLRACEYNSNIKVIKYIHKLFPSFIHSQITLNDGQNESVENGAYLILKNLNLIASDKVKILHYLYLNGIDIHLLSKKITNRTVYDSIYTFNKFFVDNDNIVLYLKVISQDGIEYMNQYLKVISQDFDYLHNEHDDAYRKPSFWKQFHNNNNNNNNNIADEQSMRINEWKNRFDEHVLHHLSKMIQEHMLDPKQFDYDDDYEDF